MPDKPNAKVSAFFKQHKMLAWGGIIGGGALAVIIWRRRSAAQAAQNQPATPSGVADTGAGAIDPQTGFPVGSAEDAQALQQMSAGTGYYGTGYDPYAGGYSPFPVGPPVTGAPAPTTGTTTNDQWFLQAENVLPNGKSAAVETAISRVLGGLTVTWAQRALFLEAVGILGPPPGGYPQPIRTSHAGGDTGGSHQKVRVPDVRGKTYAAAVAELALKGLRAHHEGRKAPTKILFQSPDPGDEVRRGSTVTVTGGTQ